MLWSVLASAFFPWLAWAADDDDPYEFFHFVTRPDISAPKWDIKVFDGDALQQEGHYWFIAPYQNLTQQRYPRWNGPHIYDLNGELVWSGAPLAEYFNTYDFRMNEINGEQMLTYIWQKDGGGTGQILDSSYQPYANVDMAGAFSEPANMHEFNLIDDGNSVLILAPDNNTITEIDVPKYKGPCKFGHQAFQAIDINTGKITLEWHTQHRISPEERGLLPNVYSAWEGRCLAGESSVYWDALHMNAVDKFDDGDFLISARDTNTIYKVSHVDHSIVWRLGGIWSDFEFRDERAKFSHQHHARFRSQNETHIVISLFDNATPISGNGVHFTSSESWGKLVVLRIDVTPMTAELLVRFEKPIIGDAGYYTYTRGSMSFLTNGNVFMGWVGGCHISEHDPNGKPLMTAIMRTSITRIGTYRSYKLPWVGHPSQPPDVAATVERKGDDLTTIVHVSWNGATEVDTWNVLRTNKLGDISALVASSPRRGFETRIALDGVSHYVITVAMDRKGHEIGRSIVITVGLPADLQTPSVVQSEQEWVTSHASSWWEAPLQAHSTTKATLTWFIVGFLCCVTLSCVGIWSCVRQRTYGRDEGELDQQTPMLNEKPVEGEEDEHD